MTIKVLAAYICHIYFAEMDIFNGGTLAFLAGPQGKFIKSSRSRHFPAHSEQGEAEEELGGIGSRGLAELSKFVCSTLQEAQARFRTPASDK